jgi:hypothetical protein
MTPPDEDESPGVVREILDLLRENRTWWLLPLVLALLLVGLLVAFGGATAAPFVYTLF